MKCTSAVAADVALGEQLLGVVLADRRAAGGERGLDRLGPKPFVTASTATVSSPPAAAMRSRTRCNDSATLAASKPGIGNRWTRYFRNDGTSKSSSSSS